jgi:hypothetical protein
MGLPTSAHGTPRVRERLLQQRLAEARFAILASNVLFGIYLLVLLLK